jgi:hypothetical protein
MNIAPTIMVSSTFYDLRQIRIDLHNFISTDLGYNPLQSEFPSFPVDPDIDTISNCRKNVERNANIMVLIVGGRYGSIDSKTNKSITNLEFLTAKAKGIPIYVFVDEAVLSIIPIWKKNPEGIFSDVVDTSKIFEFIELVRSSERVWTFEFRTAQDIIKILRIQLAYLFQDALIIRQKYSETSTPRFLEQLRSNALRLALEQPEAWEHRLFFQSWLDEIELRSDIIREYKVGLRLETSIYVPKENAIEWFLTRMQEIENITDSTMLLINNDFLIAIGESGKPGNAEHIVWISRMIGAALERALVWAKTMRCARCEEPFDELPPEASLFVDDFITKLIDTPIKFMSQIMDALNQPKSDKMPELHLTMKLELSNSSRFNEKMNKAKRYYGIIDK